MDQFECHKLPFGAELFGKKAADDERFSFMIWNNQHLILVKKPVSSDLRVIQANQDCTNLTLACFAAEQSPDPSTQVGTCLVSPHPSLYTRLLPGESAYTDGWVARGKETISNLSSMVLECNRCIPALELSPEEYQNRTVKYRYVEHAERNAIYTASKNAIPTTGATLYATWFACCECARAIAASGIKRVVGHAHFGSFVRPEWKENIEAAQRIFDAASIETVWIPEKDRAAASVWTYTSKRPLTGNQQRMLVDVLNNSSFLEPSSIAKLMDTLFVAYRRLYVPKIRFAGETIDFHDLARR